MNRPERWMMVVLLAVLATAAPPASADDAAQRFDQAFGDRLRAAADWPARLELAGEMLDAARDAHDDPALLTLLCERVYQITSERPAGFGHAVDAMRLLARHADDRREDALARAAALHARRMRIPMLGADGPEGQRTMMEILIDLGELHQDRGDWDAARAYFRRAHHIAGDIGSPREPDLALAISQVDTRRRIDALRRRLQRDRTDTEAAEQLMRLLVVELDDPAAAREHRFAADDRALVDNVERAARDVANLFIDELLELGDWYRGLAADASPAARPVMRARARLYYQQYLERHRGPSEAQGAQRAVAALAELDRQDEADGTPVAEARPTGAAAAPQPPPSPILAERTAPPPAGDDSADAAGAAAIDIADAIEPDGRTNLFAGVEPSTHGVRGIWAFDNGALSGGPPTPAQLILPWAVTGDYELQITFTRTSPIGAVAVHIPVARHNALIVLGERRRRQRDYIAGLSRIEGEHATDNPTTTPFEPETGRTYTLRIRVEAAPNAGQRITAAIDGDPLFQWEGFAASLSVANIWDRLDPRAIGLATDAGAQVLFHSAHLHVLDGAAEPLE